MKKLEIIIRPEKLDELKEILNSCNAHGLMISNIMGYGLQNRLTTELILAVISCQK